MIEKDDLKKMFHIRQDRTIGSYVKNGCLPRPINADGRVFFRKKKIFNFLGLIKEPNEPILTSKDASDFFCIHPSTVKHYAKSHNIPYYCFKDARGSNAYFLGSELQKIAECKRVGGEYAYKKIINGRVVSCKTKLHFKSKQKRIAQFDLRGNLIRIYDRAEDVIEFGFSPENIRDYLKKRRSANCLRKFGWGYYDSIKKLSKEELVKFLFPALRKRGTKIRQADWNGKTIKIWDSISEAVRHRAVSSSVSRELKIKKTVSSKGCLWSYLKSQRRI